MSLSSSVVKCIATCELLLVCLATTLVLGCTRRPQPPTKSQTRESQPSDIALPQAVALKDRSLALLENGWDTDHDQKLLTEAQTGFESLAQKFPTDPLGVQNLSLTLLARLKQTDRAEQSELFASLDARLTQELKNLAKLTPQEPTADILSARQNLLKAELSSAIDNYRSAAKRPLAGPDTHFQLYTQLQAQYLATDPQDENELNSHEESGKALKAALDLTPENLALVIEWLRHLARAQERTLIDQIAKNRDLFRPLTARTSSVIPKLLDAAAKAAEEGNWQTAVLQTNFLRNVAVAEIAFQHSQHLLEPHELEFVRLQFSEPSQALIMAQTPKATLTQRTLPAVKFVPQDKFNFIKEELTAIATADFNLDKHDDLWCTDGENLRVFSFAIAGQPKTLCDVKLTFAVSGMALADFDRDFQQRKDSLPASALPTTTPPQTAEPTSAEPIQLTESQLIEKYLDTDLDLVAYGTSGLRLLRNDLDASTGQRTLTVVPQAGLDKLTTVRSVAIIDLDHDSDLDLAVSSDSGISFWSNRGDWTFADFSSFSQLPAAPLVVNDILALDVDRNVLNDFVLAAEASEESLVLKSNLHGRYFKQADPWLETGFGGARSLANIDANADACWDILSCGAQGTQLTLMKSVGRHGWLPESRQVLSDVPMFDLLVDDFDHDGWEDCVAWGTNGLEFFRPDANGKLAKDSTVLTNSLNTQQVVALDIDQDQDLDLVCVDSQGKLQLFDNQGGNANQHLELVIRADEDGKQRPRERCNMHGVGSLVEIKSGDKYQSRIVRGPRTRFGLGQQASADVMRIVWTNGIPNNVLNVSNRATVYDQQNLGGSCPYLYAWNGSRFEFCTDCLWAAPIGLQFAQGLAAPSREWEYLRIDGSMLQPLNGEYVLQMTEELWEAAYFDSVQLLAVDHPADVEIYTNEKVGPAELAEFKVHVVEQRKTPARVVDTQGRDLSEIVATRDGRFTKTWEQGLNQGLTEEHWLEIDLGKVQNPNHVRLFLTGWMFPTCTSINLSMSENPLKPRQKPPAIWMPNEQGEWVETIPYAGFPGGKTKTIVIDLSDKFLCDDHRLRLVSNMELCWDEVFYSDTPQPTQLAGRPRSSPDTLVDPAGRYRIHPQPLIHADLHYRGFSKLVPQPFHAPKRFDYQDVSPSSIWPPMRGAFTRFGEVTKLIEEPDDLQVVMGAGDEMTLRFQASELPTVQGWVRDFVIYNVGWDKDADLNTIHGQTVEPLPFSAMQQYPYAPGQTFPDTPVHREYLESYQTRVQSQIDFWNQIRDDSRTQ